MKLTEISKNLQLYELPCYCDKEYSRHSYLSYKYDELFLPYKDKEIYLLEIGVYKGGSLVLWHEYFKKANIHGMDLRDERCDLAKSLGRVQFIQKDAYYNSTINSIPEKYYDIVIEDGSHFIDHQLAVISKYKSKINDGGMLIVEDIHGEDNLVSCYKAAVSVQYKTIEVYDNRGATKIYDEIILVCRN